MRFIIFMALGILMCSCAVGDGQSGTVQDPLQMPEIFLGQWYHDGQRFLLTVKPDGTMEDVYIEDNKVIDEYQYKIIHVYGPERVAILFKETSHYPDHAYYNKWSKPRFSLLWIDYPKVFPDILDPDFLWGSDCYAIAGEKEWENIDQYRDVLMQRIEALYPTSGCVDGSYRMKMRSVDEHKFD